MTQTLTDSRKSENRKRAVILIGHGSRAAGADDDMDRVAAHLRTAINGTVEVCRMGGRGISLEEAFERCIRQGADEIIVLPYFLHFGVHLRQDIPEMLLKTAANHPEIRLVLGRHLGYDDALARLVQQRLIESASLCDIRELPPVPIDEHPKEAGDDMKE